MEIQIGVIGAGSCDSEIDSLAEEVGREIAKRRACLLCGGMEGVMEAACRGCKKEGGKTIGILPGPSANEANPYVDIAIVTDMGHARNAIIAASCDAAIAVGGEYGTLSEIALSIKNGKPVIRLCSKWDIEGTIPAHSAKEAVDMAFKKIN